MQQPKFEPVPDRTRFYNKISKHNLTPLWEVLGTLVPPSPQTPIKPTIWHYADVRNMVLEAGNLITAREAERRVLILENPGVRGQSRITQSLYAGLQLILPGEVAPAHRHTQSALRLVLDGDGAYTAVDGERISMHHGDFIITPAMTWHDHGNPSDKPMVWLDGLDIPLVQFLDAGFFEKSTQETRITTRPEGDSLARYGRNLLPLDFEQRSSDPTKVSVYPFAETRETLLKIARTVADLHFGYKMRYINPATGKSPMPTIGACAQYLPSGFETAPYRSTDGTVYACLEGSGTAKVGDQSFQFNLRDIFVVPSWHSLTLQAKQDTFLFSFSDYPVQQVLGLWREEKQ